MESLATPVPNSPIATPKAAASWAAIVAGAFVAAAVSLTLFALGSGLGLALVSPWQSPSVTTFAVSTAIWLIVMQWLSAAIGGYVAGRLRTRWISTNPHEVFFRDTAHGLVTWAVATVAVTTLMASSVANLLGGALHAAAGSATAAQAAAGKAPIDAYELDRLFRPTDFTVPEAGPDSKAEADLIVTTALAGNGAVADADRSYLANLVAARTGAPLIDAGKRVDDFISAAHEATAKATAKADALRSASSKAATFTALALVIGAFIACLSAVLGGRLRDEHP